jgi:hypothetical protein
MTTLISTALSHIHRPAKPAQAEQREAQMMAAPAVSQRARTELAAALTGIRRVA